jgi:hypothetical protein
MRIPNMTSPPGGAHPTIALLNRSQMLRAPEGDPSGAGDGGADEEARVTAVVNKVVQKIFSEREKRLEKRISDAMNATLGTKLDELRKALIEDTNAEPAPQPTGQNGQPPANGAGLSKEQLAEIAQARKDAAEAKASADKYRKEADDERKARSTAEERTALQAALGGLVKPALLDMVVDALHKNVVRDPESNAILYKGADGELVPYRDGIGAWSKTDFGKEVAPPRELGGGGGRGPGDGAGKGPFTLETLGGIIAGSIPGNSR